MEPQAADVASRVSRRGRGRLRLHVREAHRGSKEDAGRAPKRVSESLMPGKAEYSAALFRQCACSDGKGVKSVQPDLEGRHQPTL